jgi:hypothetical protein
LIRPRIGRFRRLNVSIERDASSSLPAHREASHAKKQGAAAVIDDRRLRFKHVDAENCLDRLGALGASPSGGARRGLAPTDKASRESRSSATTASRTDRRRGLFGAEVAAIVAKAAVIKVFLLYPKSTA